MILNTGHNDQREKEDVILNKIDFNFTEFKLHKKKLLLGAFIFWGNKKKSSSLRKYLKTTNKNNFATAFLSPNH